MNMHKAGEHLVSFTPEEAVVRGLGARYRTHDEAAGSAECEFSQRVQDGSTTVALRHCELEGSPTVCAVTVGTDYQASYVEAVQLLHHGELEREPPRVRPRRARKSAEYGLDAAALADADVERAQMLKRELADILACIFAEAQAAGRLDASVGMRSEKRGSSKAGR